jgi:hypothetical protein
MTSKQKNPDSGLTDFLHFTSFEQANSLPAVAPLAMLLVK